MHLYRFVKTTILAIVWEGHKASTKIGYRQLEKDLAPRSYLKEKPTCNRGRDGRYKTQFRPASGIRDKIHSAAGRAHAGARRTRSPSNARVVGVIKCGCFIASIRVDDCFQNGLAATALRPKRV